MLTTLKLTNTNKGVNMSCSLSYRKTPKNGDWLGCFKGGLRDQLRNKFGEGSEAITEDDIAYLEGVRDSYSQSDDVKDLDKILKILREGGTIDLEYDC